VSNSLPTAVQSKLALEMQAMVKSSQNRAFCHLEGLSKDETGDWSAGIARQSRRDLVRHLYKRTMAPTMDAWHDCELALAIALKQKQQVK
jgi:hypothetical protein